MGRENKEVGAMPTCYCLCCQPCLPNFQCFQSCVSWTPFCIFSFCYFSFAVVWGTYPWVAISYANQKSLSRGAEYDDRHHRAPLFSLASDPLNLKPTTDYEQPFVFAEDLVLLASSEQDLQQAHDQFATTCDHVEIKIMTKKAKGLCLSRNPSQCALQVSGKTLQQIKKL